MGNFFEIEIFVLKYVFDSGPTEKGKNMKEREDKEDDSVNIEVNKAKESNEELKDQTNKEDGLDKELKVQENKRNDTNAESKSDWRHHYDLLHY